MKHISVLLLFGILLASCSEPAPKEIQSEANELPAELEKVLDAHGGLDRWNEMQAMTYVYNRGDRKEKHQIDLKTRKVRLDGGEWVIGFDGKEVWVSPEKAAYTGRSARFYHNLIFYFYAMPFVLADPGINYEMKGPKEILGKTYEQISVTYNDGVGDAPDDEYILCYDPETGKMEWLLYTVTYFSGEPGSKYNALNYDSWKEVEGLLLPESMTGYRTSGDTITEKRYDNLFEDIVLSKDAFDQSIFEMPEGAEIDSLK